MIKKMNLGFYILIILLIYSNLIIAGNSDSILSSSTRERLINFIFSDKRAYAISYDVVRNIKSNRGDDFNTFVVDNEIDIILRNLQLPINEKISEKIVCSMYNAYGIMITSNAFSKYMNEKEIKSLESIWQNEIKKRELKRIEDNIYKLKSGLAISKSECDVFPQITLDNKLFSILGKSECKKNKSINYSNDYYPFNHTYNFILKKDSSLNWINDQDNLSIDEELVIKELTSLKHIPGKVEVAKDSMVAIDVYFKLDINEINNDQPIYNIEFSIIKEDKKPIFRIDPSYHFEDEDIDWNYINYFLLNCNDACKLEKGKYLFTMITYKRKFDFKMDKDKDQFILNGSKFSYYDERYQTYNIAAYIKYKTMTPYTTHNNKPNIVLPCH